MNHANIVGTWKLVSWENINSEGQISKPYGDNPVGYIAYTEDGYMSVSVMAPNRPNFKSEDVLEGTTEENASAAKTYFSYCGTYIIDEEKVIHRVEMSLFPNWTNQDMKRFFVIKGDQLIIDTPPFPMKGPEQKGRLTWERA